MAYTVRLNDRLDRSDAWNLVPDALIDLRDRNCEFYLPNSHDRVLIARHHIAGAIGFLSFYLSDRNSFWVTLAYVKPEFRKIGVHTSLFNALAERAVAKKIHKIESGTHINNLDMQKVMSRQGREAVSVSYDYVVTNTQDLEPTDDFE